MLRLRCGMATKSDPSIPRTRCSTRVSRSSRQPLTIPAENVRLISPFIGGGFPLVNFGSTPMPSWRRSPQGNFSSGAAKSALTRQQVFHVTTHRSDTIRTPSPCYGSRVRPHPGHRLTTCFRGNCRASKPNGGSGCPENPTLYNRCAQSADAASSRAIYIPVASSMRAPGESVGPMALNARWMNLPKTRPRPDRSAHSKRI